MPLEMEAGTIVTRFTGDDKDLKRAYSEGERGADDFVSRVNFTFERLGSGIGRGVSKGLSIALGDIGSFVDTAEGLLSAGLKAIPGVGAGLSAAFDEVQGVLNSTVQRGFAYNDFLKESRVQLQLVTGDAGKASEILNALFKTSRQTGIGKGALVDAIQELQLFGVESGKALSFVKALSNQAAATGGGEGRVLSITNVLDRVMETGKLDSRAVRMLIRQKIPFYDILADELRISKKRAMDLIAHGDLNGDDLMVVLTSAFNKEKYVKAAEEMQQTIEAQSRKLYNNGSRLAGIATQPAYNTAEAGLEAANDAMRGPEANRAAAGIAGAISPVTTFIDKSIEAMRSGDFFGGALQAGENIIAGFKKGLSGKAEEAIGEAKSMGLNILQGAKDVLGIHSPSEEFREIGHMCAQGFADGISEGQGTANSATQRMMGSILTQARSRANLEALINREPDFLPKLAAGARSRGINPDHLLNVMALETAGSFNPAITNPYGYTGLIQFGKAAAKDLGTTTGALRQMSATEQLDYVFRYLDQHAHDRQGRRVTLDTQAKVYGAVGPGYASADDNTILFARGSKGFANNQAWNVNGDGMIQQWELATAAINKLGAGIDFTFRDLLKGGTYRPDSPVAQSLTQIHMPLSQQDRANQRTYAEQMIARLRASSAQPNSSSAPSFEDYLRQVAPGILMLKSMRDEAKSLGGVWDETNRVLKDTGGIFLDAVNDAEQLTTSMDTMARSVNLHPLIGEFDELGQLITDNSQKVKTLTDDSGDGVKKIRDKIGGFKQDLKEIGFTSQNMSEIFQNSFIDAAHHMQDGWKGVVGTMVVDFAQAVEEMIVKAEAAKLAKLLFGDGSEGSGGGWVGTFFHWLGIGASAAAGGGGGGISGDVTFSAAGGAFSATPGGRLVRVAEGGYDEVVLTTDPKYRDRTRGILSHFLSRTDLIPAYAEGGSVLGDSAYSAPASPSYAPTQTSSGGTTENHYHFHFESRAQNSYFPRRSEMDQIRRLVGA